MPCWNTVWQRSLKCFLRSLKSCELWSSWKSSSSPRLTLIDNISVQPPLLSVVIISVMCVSSSGSRVYANVLKLSYCMDAVYITVTKEGRLDLNVCPRSMLLGTTNRKSLQLSNMNISESSIHFCYFCLGWVMFLFMRQGLFNTIMLHALYLVCVWWLCVCMCVFMPFCTVSHVYNVILCTVLVYLSHSLFLWIPFLSNLRIFCVIDEFADCVILDDALLAYQGFS